MEKNISLDLMNDVLNRSDLLVYVTDPKSNEIIYISNKTKKMLDIGEVKAGDKCWRVMNPGATALCDECARGRLASNPSEEVSSEGYNLINGHYYKRIDSLIKWPDGRDVELHTFTDFTEAMRTEELMKKRLRQQEMMTGVSLSFVSIDDMQLAMSSALASVSQFMEVNAAIVSRYDFMSELMTCYAKWYDESRIGSFEDALVDWAIPLDSTLYEELASGMHFSVDDLYSSRHKVFAHLVERHVKSLLCIPLFVKEKFWGVIQFMNVGKIHRWSPNEINVCKQLGITISHVVQQDETDDELSMSRARYELDIEKAQEETEKERTSKRNFMSYVSHEIRTQLNSMLGMASVAMDSADSLRKDYAIERIELLAGNLITLADEIAELSTLESWDELAEREKVSPTVLTDETRLSMEEARRTSIEILSALDDCTIMLVEDIEVNREIIFMYLENTGLHVEVAQTGLEAFKKFEQSPHKYSLILMDIQMPEMDGYEATMKIRALDTDHAKSIPIVAMTANAFSDDIDKSFLAGMNDHITKPVDWTDLLTLLVYYLGPKEK